ncbi:MAG: AAA family ATPase, partial [Pirellulales bacterium]|nr:AAA family ATPase [Pirellulales bacterium]
MATRPIRLTIYNHKGGVGKTTLGVNIASALTIIGKSVLLVDSDPQCNLTSYLLSDDVVDDMLDKSDRPDGRTIWTALKPVFDGIGNATTIDPIEIERLNLLPGDIRLSEFEERLGEAWTDSFRRRLGGLRTTCSISDLVSRVNDHRNYDFVFYDTGPNIGPLNRVLLLDSDYFIVPVACDLFSVRALSTLGQSLKQWIIDWNTITSLAPDGASLLRGKPKFCGYIPQGFKEYGQTMAKEPSKYLRQIKKTIYENISTVLRAVDPELAPESSIDPVVGQVKDFTSLVQVA